MRGAVVVAALLLSACAVDVKVPKPAESKGRLKMLSGIEAVPFSYTAEIAVLCDTETNTTLYVMAGIDGRGALAIGGPCR